MGDFGLRDTFQERIASKAIEIDIDKLHMKSSALNVDFDGPSLDFLGSRKHAHEDIEVRFSRKSRYFNAVGQSFVLPITTNTSDELFSRINNPMSMTLKDPELPK